MKTRQLVIAFLVFGSIMALYFGPAALINEFWLVKMATSQSVDRAIFYVLVLNLAIFFGTLCFAFKLSMPVGTWEVAAALVCSLAFFGGSLVLLRGASQNRLFYGPASGEVIGFSTRKEAQVICPNGRTCGGSLVIKEIPVVKYRFKDGLGAFHEATLDRIPGTSPSMGSKKDLFYDWRDPSTIIAADKGSWQMWYVGGLFFFVGLFGCAAAGFKVYRIRKAERDAFRDDKNPG